MSQHRIQAYMEKHKLGPMFEELMNKVLRELPDDPVIYLIKCLYKKSGLDIPQDLRRGGLRKSMSDLPRNRSPERSMKAATSASVDSLAATRDYNRPWMAQAKRTKPRRSEEAEFSKSSPRSPRHSDRKAPCTPARLESWDIDEFLQVHSLSPSVSPRTSPRDSHPASPRPSPQVHSPLTPRPPPQKERPYSMAKRPGQKSDWNPDIKVKATSFDDLFDNHPGRREEVPQRMEPVADARRAWANVGLGDQGQELYSSSGYTGPHRQSGSADLLTSEVPSFSHSRSSEDSSQTAVVSSGHVRGRQVDALKHRQELGKLLSASDSTSRDSGFVDEEAVEDEAIELLEDAEELRQEGVTNIPASGYKLSRAFQRREAGPNIKLNINLFPQPLSSEPFVSDDQFADGRRFGSMGTEQDEFERPATGMSGQMSALDTDEEFESVSQVTGPRRPAWSFPDSDTDSYAPKASFGQKPQRSSKGHGRTAHSKKMGASMPVRFSKPPAGRQSTESAEGFLAKSNKTWAPALSSGEEDDSPSPPVDVQASLQSDHSGWNVPYDSDVASVHDWDQRVRGTKRDPRAY